VKTNFLLLLLLSICLSLTAQETTLYIYAPDGEPLEGAAVLGIPQNWSAYTDRNGELSIELADTVLVSYLGMIPLRLSWTELQARQGVINLQSAGLMLTEVVVGSNRLRKDLSQEKSIIQALDMQRAQVSTPAEALAAEAGAYVQMSQLGGGSPVLRGFEANRVLLVIDGVRMNNAIYRSGHLQNAITVDENALAWLEVSYGAGALAYGSDALGGVIHFHTKNPLPVKGKAKKWSSRAGFRASTATAENSLQGELTYQSSRWSSYTAITASRFGDLRTGSRRPADYPNFGRRDQYVVRENGQDIVRNNSDPDLQIGSGYEQLDVLQKVNWQATPNLRWQLNLQHSTSGDLPRFDRLIERRNGQLRFAEWYYGPQNRTLASVQLNWQANRRWADELRLIAAHQLIDEDRYDRRFGDNFREENTVHVKVNTLTLDINRRFGPQTLLQYGGLLRYDEVEAQASRRSIVDNQTIKDVNSRYPSQGSDLQAADAFLQIRHHHRDSSLLTELGARYSSQSLYAQFGANDPIAWPEFYLDGITNKNQSVNGAGGISWRRGQWQLRSHLATGFRAPNIDDYAKFRENDGFVQIPNPDLAPETSRSVDASVAYHWKAAGRLQLTAYRTWLSNVMVRENFQLPDGTDFFLDAGDTLFVQAIINADQARVWGLSLAYRHQLHTNWRLTGQLHYTYGRRDLSTKEGTLQEVPLDHIPPLYGQLRMEYHSGNWEMAVQSQFQAAKALEDYAVSGISQAGDELIYDRLGTSDNLELTPTRENGQSFAGSYAWWVLNLRGSYRIGKHLRLRANVNNVFDLHYRSFASGISAPGRNMVFGVYAWF
jgi:hemoglobin/transferrin/lactoferrin receptor protein